MFAVSLFVAAAITTSGDSVATTVAHLDKVATPEIGVHAYAMSVGPPAPWQPDTLFGEVNIVTISSRVLRVTLHQCERSEWLTIDDILLGRGDSRQLEAQYILPVFPRSDGLWIRPNRAGVLRPLVTRPQVTWQSPTAFFVPFFEDTLFVQHLGGDQFKVTARARMDYVTTEEYNRIVDSLRVQNGVLGPTSR